MILSFKSLEFDCLIDIYFSRGATTSEGKKREAKLHRNQDQEKLQQEEFEVEEVQRREKKNPKRE